MATAIFAGAFNNNGQVCSAIKRVYVPEALYDDVVEGLAAHARSIKVGEGTEDGVKLGPINNEPQYERVKELVADALSHGATAVTGGKAMDRAGYFFEPTILTGLSDGTRIVDEEQFGPALPVVPYRDLGDAIDRANATHFGLSGSVWGADADRAAEVAAQLECGTAWVNTHLALAPQQPFGGFKWSGIGVENGPWGLAEFSEFQVVHRSKAANGLNANTRDAAVVAPWITACGRPGSAARRRGRAASVEPAPAPFRSCTICSTSARAFLSAASPPAAEDRDAASRSWLAFHCAGVKASTVAARPLVALVAVPIWLLRSSMSGCSRPGWPAVTCACALVASAVRFGMAVVVASVRAGGDPGGGQHQHVDAVVAEDRPEVVRRLLHRACRPASSGSSCCSGAMSAPRYEARPAWLEPRPLAPLTLAIAALRALTRSRDVRGRLGLDAGQGRRGRAGAAVAVSPASRPPQRRHTAQRGPRGQGDGAESNQVGACTRHGCSSRPGSRERVPLPQWCAPG